MSLVWSFLVGFLARTIVLLGKSLIKTLVVSLNEGKVGEEICKLD